MSVPAITNSSSNNNHHHRSKIQGLPMDHKTVFVLDHSLAMNESSKQTIDLEFFFKKVPPSGEMEPFITYSKSLWVCGMEAVREYCRVVWDIFPHDKLFRFITSGQDSQVLNTWKSDDQCMPTLSKLLAEIGKPKGAGDASIIPGLISAVQSLAEPTEEQLKFIRQNPSIENISNSGRIIVILHAKNNDMFKTVQITVSNVIEKHNQRSTKNIDILPIDKVELVFICMKSQDSNAVVNELHNTNISDRLSVEVHDVKATRTGILISNRMLNLVQYHYDLSATSITGIPMKEEQNSALSQNYDVLLLHRRLPGTPPCDFKWATADSDLHSTMLLKWRSPKYNPDELYHCTGAARISPVDVNSRPSVCLINFLLNGRCVMLEHWDKSNSEDEATPIQVTHIISCRSGDIYLHALVREKHNKLLRNTPPYLSNMLTDINRSDLRWSEFNTMAKQFTLNPLGGVRWMEDCQNMKQSQHILQHLTKYWPLYTTKTVAIVLAPSIVDVMSRDQITPDDVIQVQNVIFQLFKKEADKVPLTNPQHSGRGKRNVPKVTYNYNELWLELEALLRAFARSSKLHVDVLNCFLKCMSKPLVEDIEKWLAHNNKSSLPVKRKRTSTDTKPSITFSEVIKESPESPPSHHHQPPQSKKIKLEPNESMGSSPRSTKPVRSVLNIWNSRTETANSQCHDEFYGRIADGSKYRLYPDIKDDTPSSNNSSGNNPHGDRHRHHYHHHRNMTGGHHHRASSNGSSSGGGGGGSGRSTPIGGKMNSGVGKSASLQKMKMPSGGGNKPPPFNK